MLSRPCFNLHSLEDLPELDHIVGPSIPTVVTKAGIIPGYDDSELLSPVPGKRRIINVTNHLPIKAFKDACRKWQFELDEDALSLQFKDGLGPDVEILHVGSLKVDVDPTEQDEVSTYLIEKFRCLPVFIQEDLRNKFYHGFCKHYLWPLFHYQLPMSSGLISGSGYDRTLWQAYVSANLMFAHRVFDVIKFGDGEDLVWVHDYHLMLLPTLVRRRAFRVKLGFFLHSPFPSSEIFRAIPVRDQILRGFLNADLVGFHIFDYGKHFLSCCSRLLGLDYQSKRGYLGIDYYGRTVSVKILPVGIHMGQLRTLMSKPETTSRFKELKEKFKGKTVLVGVDDMDVLKGISFKFLAFGHLLEMQPKYRGELVLVQIANPARSQGKDVQEVQREILKIAKEINAKYGEPGYNPIVFINGPVSSLEKAAYYAIADCCLLNAVRDGMNLVPYKYTVCRQGSPELDLALGMKDLKRSAIIVSEFVGCSPSLSGAIRVNPWNVEQVSEAIHDAIKMNEKEQQLRHEQHYKYISSHDIAYWVRSFNQDLIRASGDLFAKRCWGVGFGLSFRLVALAPDFKKLSVDHIEKAYKSTKNRLILLDYDGTMTPQSSMDKPPSDEVMQLLGTLCRDPKNTVFIVSGRSREKLDKMFSSCEKLGISAEHGYFTRWTRDSPWEAITNAANFEWKQIVHPVMELYAEATDGSFIEEEESAMVWHYQDADFDFGSCQAKELLDHLENVLTNEPVMVKRGKHKVEVKPQGVNKGVVVDNLIATMRKRSKTPDFVLCIGDDRSDEDMFESIGKANSDPVLLPIAEVFACTVGQKPSMAKYYLDDTFEVLMMLGRLAGVHIEPPQVTDAQAQVSSECDGSLEVEQLMLEIKA